MNTPIRTTEAKICAQAFAACNIASPAIISGAKPIIERILMVGGVLTGFRKQEGGFYLEDDGMDGGYRLSYADTDYLLHVARELSCLGYNLSSAPRIRISNLAYNGSIFDHIKNGETTDCMVLANLYWNPDRNASKNPRKNQDERNFDGKKWRDAFDQSGANILAVIHSQCSGGNHWSRNVPDMISEEAGLSMYHQSQCQRTSHMSGKTLTLESAFFIG
ncbi:MAG: hypothetical protein AAF244_04420 [Pseudomonadota bacterium]